MGEKDAEPGSAGGKNRHTREGQRGKGLCTVGVCVCMSVRVREGGGVHNSVRVWA